MASNVRPEARRLRRDPLQLRVGANPGFVRLGFRCGGGGIGRGQPYSEGAVTTPYPRRRP